MRIIRHTVCPLDEEIRKFIVALEQYSLIAFETLGNPHMTMLVFRMNLWPDVRLRKYLQVAC